MSGEIATLEAPSASNVASGAARNILPFWFVSSADTFTEDARKNVESYLAAKIPGSDASLALVPDSDAARLTTSLSLTYSAAIAPAQMEAFKGQMETALKEHPLLGAYSPVMACAAQEDGQVKVTATLPGLNAQDYARLVRALASAQHQHDVDESNGLHRRDDVFDLHHKMKEAAENLTAMVHKEAANEGKKLPDFTLTLEKREGAEPGKVILDLRIAGLSDRANAQPVMGALTAAFHKRKRKGRFSAMHQEDLHHDLVVDEHQLHAHTHEMHHGVFGALISHLAEPLEEKKTEPGELPKLTIHGGTASLLGLLNEEQLRVRSN